LLDVAARLLRIAKIMIHVVLLASCRPIVESDQEAGGKMGEEGPVFKNEQELSLKCDRQAECKRLHYDAATGCDISFSFASLSANRSYLHTEP
jgi:hypothetical protein